MVGAKAGYEAPPAAFAGEGTVLLVGSGSDALGGSELLAQVGGSDRFPALPESAGDVVATLAEVADAESTLAVHDVSNGGLAVALAEMVTADTGADVAVDDLVSLFEETPGRAVVETANPSAVEAAFDGVAPVTELGEATDDGTLSLSVGGENLAVDADSIASLRDVLAAELD
jgi:phosphoribosylformylglycinamidine synthase